MITSRELRLIAARGDDGRIPRDSVATAPMTSAANGNPWCTQEDWRREEMRARNPAAPGHESARAFTQRARLYPTMARPRAPFTDKPRPLPVSAKVRLKQAQRENFEAVLRAARACEREPLLRECSPAAKAASTRR